MSQKLEGKVAVNTGGSSGIGLATAKRFVAEGAYVFIPGRRETELSKAAEEIGINVSPVRSDVANLTDIDHLYNAVREHGSQLDIVFANAGICEFGLECKGCATIRGLWQIFLAQEINLLYDTWGD